MNSIDHTLHKYGRVQTGLAQQFSSDRFLNPNALVCPTRNHTDGMGRHSDHNSLNTQTAGCNNATERVRVEVGQRPVSFTSASLSSIGIQHGGGGGGVMGLARVETTGHVVPDNRARYSQNMRDRQWIDLGNKVLHYKNLSGMDV